MVVGASRLRAELQPTRAPRVHRSAETGVDTQQGNWLWVAHLDVDGNWADMSLVDCTLDLLRLLGVVVGSTAAPPEWAPVRTSWMAYCESQPDKRDKKSPKPRVTSRDDARVTEALRTPRDVQSLSSENGGAEGGSRGEGEADGGKEGEGEQSSQLEVEGGFFWLALRLILHSLAEPLLAQGQWERYLGWLGHLVQMMQPAVHQSAKKGQQVGSKRRQRLQYTCGRWQAGLLEARSRQLLPPQGGVSMQGQPAPAQGILLFALARLHAMMRGLSPSKSSAPAEPESPRAPEKRSAYAPQRQSALETILMMTLGLLEPYPWPAARATKSSQLHSAAWSAACTPLFREVLLIGWNARAVSTHAALTARSNQIARLQSAQKLQKARENRELEHGTEKWQDQLVVLHELEMERRIDLKRLQGQQERQVARLWHKLQRRLTHQRAPWAPPH